MSLYKTLDGIRRVSSLGWEEDTGETQHTHIQASYCAVMVERKFIIFLSTGCDWALYGETLENLLYNIHRRQGYSERRVDNWQYPVLYACIARRILALCPLDTFAKIIDKHDELTRRRKEICKFHQQQKKGGRIKINSYKKNGEIELKDDTVRYVIQK